MDTSLFKKKRKKFTLVLAASGAVLAVSAACCFSLSHAAEPGSPGDPFVLRSYVDAKISALESRFPADPSSGGTASQGEDLTARIQTLTERLDQLSADNASLRRSIRSLSSDISAQNGSAESGSASSGTVANTADGNAGSAAEAEYETNTGFVPVEFTENQRITLGQGTELVLRTGKALAIRGELGGIIDLITGRELEAGESVAVNHLLLSSRDDSRGVKFSENSWALVKGAYSSR